MKKFFAATIFVVAFIVPTVAQADLRTEANHLRTEVVHHFGARAPGRNIVTQGVWTGRRVRSASPAEVQDYIRTLRRMLSPPARVTPVRVTTAGTTFSHVYTRTVASVTGARPASGLAACIIQHESGGNSQAVNGQYTGIAQWSPTSWANGGGTRYASSPTGATKAEQVSVLNNMLAHGQAGQWTPYDHCG